MILGLSFINPGRNLMWLDRRLLLGLSEIVTATREISTSILTQYWLQHKNVSMSLLSHPKC